MKNMWNKSYFWKNDLEKLNLNGQFKISSAPWYFYILIINILSIDW